MKNINVNKLLSELNCYTYYLNETNNIIERNNKPASPAHIFRDLFNITKELKSNGIKYEVDKDENILM